jgi:DNA-binding MarR family transcriptional regulator
MAETRSKVAPRPPRPEPEELLELFRGAFIAFKHRQRALLDQAGLSISEWTGLHLCSQGGARAREIAETIGLTPAGVTSLIDRLEGRRLVRRLRDPTDRRAIRIELTSTGRQLHDGTRRRVIRLWRGSVERLTPTEYAGLATGLRGLVRLEDPAAMGSPPGG